MANALAQGIYQSANALGMNPLDLATIVSYETGGTFDPTKAGPTTQWGQHKGLIQFGQPQAEKYGVDWNDPVGSQLGADGAVVRYFRDNGYQPGMGLLDAYSIVNAGAPGRYNASDANNGGAPGTVADKVNDQMAGHRRNAERLLGGGMSESGDGSDYLAQIDQMSRPGQQPQQQADPKMQKLAQMNALSQFMPQQQQPGYNYLLPTQQAPQRRFEV